MIEIVKYLKSLVKSLRCLGILNLEVFFIIKIDASDIGYDRILK